MHALPKESVIPPLKHVFHIHNISPEQTMRTLVKKVLKKNKNLQWSEEKQNQIAYPFIGGTASQTWGSASFSLLIC